MGPFEELFSTHLTRSRSTRKKDTSMHVKVHISDIIFIAIIGGVTWWLNDRHFGGLPLWTSLGAYGLGRLSQFIQDETSR